MADLKLLAVLAIGKPGVPGATNYGLITKLKVGNITIEGDTVDGVDVAAHDAGTAKAEHSLIGDHAHTGSGAEAGQLSHATAFSAYGSDDHTEYVLADGTRAFTGEVSGVTPTSSAKLATKGYVDAAVSNLKVLESVVVRAQGNVTLSGPGATIDGVTMQVDDRFLADQQSSSTEDGIYLWKGAAVAAVRTADAQSGASFAGRFTFVEEGTDADVGLVCTNDQGSDILGTDDISMSAFTHPGDITGGDGIDVTSYSVAVDLAASNPGLEFSSNKLRVKAATAAGIELTASGVAIKLETTNPSMQFASNEVGIKFDADGGLQKVADGTAIKLSGTTLQLAAGGISVKGVGSLFEVAGVAVSANVTAANLNDLTDGTATTLHSHTGTDPHGPSSHTEGTAWRMAYQDASGDEQEFALGADATFLESNGASSAPAFRALVEADISDLGTTIHLDSEATTHAGLDTGVHGAGASTLATAADIATHAGEADPHTGYRLESADHTHESTGTEAGKLDHGDALDGLADNDHTQYILHSLATAANDFLVASGSGAFVKKTLAETGSILEGDIDHGNIQGIGDDDHSQYLNVARHDSDDHSGFTDDSITWSGDHEFDGETIVDELIGDGDYAGIQIPRTVGTGGITIGDVLTFDGTGQIIRRSGPDQIFAGIACTTTAASSTGYYMPIGVGKALFTSGDEPSTPGENVFVDNTSGNYNKLTTDVQTDGIVYSFVALETGALAKVMIIPRRIFAFE